MTAWEVLGVLPTATKAEVRKRYHELSQIHHPDKGGDAAKFAELSAAFQVVLDAAPEKIVCSTCNGSGIKTIRSRWTALTMPCDCLREER